jgi:hypothetical protein
VGGGGKFGLVWMFGGGRRGLPPACCCEVGGGTDRIRRAWVHWELDHMAANPAGTEDTTSREDKRASMCRRPPSSCLARGPCLPSQLGDIRLVVRLGPTNSGRTKLNRYGSPQLRLPEGYRSYCTSPGRCILAQTSKMGAASSRATSQTGVIVGGGPGGIQLAQKLDALANVIVIEKRDVSGSCRPLHFHQILFNRRPLYDLGCNLRPWVQSPRLLCQSTNTQRRTHTVPTHDSRPM